MLISDHGYFWWGDIQDTTIPEMSARVPGILNVDEDGAISLELLGTLGGVDENLALFAIPVAHERPIRGILKQGQDHVILFGAVSDGGRVGGFRVDRMRARYALVSSRPVSAEKFDELRMSLVGFEAWTRPGQLVLDEEDDELRLTFSRREADGYATSAGRVELRHDFAGKRPEPTATAAAVSMVSRLEFVPNSAETLEGMYGFYRTFQDLILVLSNSERLCDWPKLRSSGSELWSTLYFKRFGDRDVVLPWYEAWLPFPRLKDTFGLIVDGWITNREALGPGIHLFLGTRRSLPMYQEHRFVNLVWGLEALHRRSHGDGHPSSPTPTPLDAKIQRIVEAVRAMDGLKSDDKRWLRELVQNKGEPTLADRLLTVLTSIGLPIEKSRLRTFANECAGLRNDLSHYGGERTPRSYDQFIQRVSVCAEALGHLYHLLVLRLIGVSVDNVTWLIHWQPTGRIKGSLVAAKLMDSERPEQGRPPSPQG